MSKKLLDQDSGGEIKDTYKLVWPYKHNGKVSGMSKLSPGMQKDDRPEVGAGNPAGLFFKDGNLHCSWSAKDDFKKEFGTPMYNECEEEYLHNIHDELVVETKPADEKNQDAMKSQKVEARKDNKGTGGDTLPLCYASFELIRHMIKASKQKQKETKMV